jgi:hypothetical protein
MVGRETSFIRYGLTPISEEVLFPQTANEYLGPSMLNERDATMTRDARSAQRQPICTPARLSARLCSDTPIAKFIILNGRVLKPRVEL